MDVVRNKVRASAEGVEQERMDRTAATTVPIHRVETAATPPAMPSPPLTPAQPVTPHTVAVSRAPMTLGAGASLDMIWMFAGAAFVGIALLAWGYNAAPNPTLGANEAIPGLAFYTLGAGLLVVIVQFGFFLQSSRNRAAAERVITK